MPLLITIIVLITIVGCRRSNQWGGSVPLTGIDKVDLLLLHNSARNSELKMDLACDEAAQGHADWMAAHESMVHDRPWTNTDKSVGDRLKKQWHSVGENIAMGQETPTEVFNDWMNSSGHKANIKGKSYNHVGFGITKSKDGTSYWCTVFSD